MQKLKAGEVGHCLNVHNHISDWERNIFYADMLCVGSCVAPI